MPAQFTTTGALIFRGAHFGHFSGVLQHLEHLDILVSPLPCAPFASAWVVSVGLVTPSRGR